MMVLPDREKIAVIGLAILIWYLSSAVANTTSRKFLTGIPLPLFLSLSQFFVATFLLHLYLRVFKFQPYMELSITSPSKARTTVLRLAAVYTTGFIFVNAGYVIVNVSLAETLRSAEPLVSVVLAMIWLKHEKVTNLMLVSMVPIVVGGALSSFGDSTFSPMGLLFVTISNLSFSLRSLLTKKLQEDYSGDALNVFYHVSRIGLLYLVLINFGLEVMGIMLGLFNLRVSACFDLLSYDELQLLCINGFCYFLYNQMSFFVLSKVEMVTHAVANAFRRVVTILVSVWYFGNEINTINAVGIFLAISGVLLYSKSKDSIRKEQKGLPRN